ncbi:Transcriptional regulator, RpiR family [Marinobacterium lacunae]|uniref:Transcriptional regulator, RpiR family n=1 Tax=Marinobacterium lacunae TaxID=1232683 RepID=A0A081FY91_9GAMM|nr:MurR/RpiR family transcriptional regulator [Marinobacterium lacunae]KEA63496.1 Transcriptional regulator, RpiR family [Marinobacterium lacunae]
MENLFSSHSQSVAPRLAKKLQASMPQLSASEARVAQYVLLNLHQMGFETGASIAKNAAVSPITVSRFFNKLGFKGISALKRELKQEMTEVEGEGPQADSPGKPLHYEQTLAAESQALAGIARQVQSEMWSDMTRVVADAQRVFVTGFQSVRGLSEDFGKRLGLARDGVQYISAHDSMLSEWIAIHADAEGRHACLVLIDVVPYAGEGRILCQMAAELGMELIIITDESCHWATEYTRYVVYAKSRTGLFLESTSALTLALNMLVDSVAAVNPEISADRSERWQAITRRLGLF